MKAKILFIAMLLTGACCGCKDSFLNRIPEGTYVDTNFYASDEALEAATAPLYNKAWFEYNRRAIVPIGSGRANDMYSPWNYPEFVTFQVTALNENLSSAWSAFYSVITLANQVINDIATKSTADVSEGAKAKAIAESRLMRACAYFYMVRIWGPVIIIEDNQAVVDNPTRPLNREEDVFQFIINDLTYAAENLPETSSQPGRATSWAAKGILAKVYLARSGWKRGGQRDEADLEMARNYAADVCENSGLNLLPNYEDLFKYKFNNNKESLLAMQWVPLGEWGVCNTLLDFTFTADPTAVEYEGRLYVYATNDQQQYEAVGGYGKNSYEHIKSLVMMSTDDMVNWTYHGLIPTGDIAPWIKASWAPSIVKREEADGKTHFYLYFSNSGDGTGVLTATSPVGPWTSPLTHSLVDTETPGIAGECKAAFDPGVVIDDKETGWLAVGGGCARIMRLGKDMISVDGPIVPVNAPHHFEANEMNYINGTYVYTYNIDWQDLSDWPLPTEKPTICCMSYMTSKTPLVSESWQYQHNYMKNPGEYGFEFGNNHTHLHKYRGKWYIFYHTMSLQHSFNTTGGFRNVCVDEIDVDENTVNIHMGKQTLKGVDQIQAFNPFILQQTETTAATQHVKFRPGEKTGNMWAETVPGKTGILQVRGVNFDQAPAKIQIYASGKGTIEIRRNTPDGELIASVNVNSPAMKLIEQNVSTPVNGTANLCFLLKGEQLCFDQWQFGR